jgi:hypothetical protein
MGQPLGKRLFEVCEIVERIQPCTYRQIWLEHGGIELTNAKKYAERGIKHELLVVNRLNFPATYTVAPGWRERFTKPQPIQPRKAEPPRRFVTSVFDLGAL